jgi:hypothetical protein
MNRRTFASCIIGAAGYLALLGCASPTLAARLVDVSIISRSTGERLPLYRHAGRLYVAGTPGEPYAIELRGHAGERVLTVLSVDGVNALTGQTAATLQSGYVIDGARSYAVAGWRKSMDDVAQFVFTSLADSYAARTGRPGSVGVIGVAVYRERVAPPQPLALAPYSPPAEPWRGELRPQARDEATREALDGPSRQASSAPPALAKKAESDAADAGAMASGKALAGGVLTERRGDRPESGIAPRPEPELKSRKLGTGHGEREYSPTRYTEFVRNSDTPDEVITIYYDSRPNLIARGIIPGPRLAEPMPFPGGGGFVPDPRG